MGTFRNNKNKENISSINIITYGTKIVGTITVGTDFRLDGEIEGNVVSKAKVVIGEKGVLKGDLTCDNAEIIGKVDGNVNVNNTLTLHSTAVLNGDITVKTLVVESNAVFNGTCSIHNERVNNTTTNHNNNIEVDKNTKINLTDNYLIDEL